MFEEYTTIFWFDPVTFQIKFPPRESTVSIPERQNITFCSLESILESR